MTDYTLGSVISSRIRLARNINGYAFPARLQSNKQAKEIIRAVSAAVNELDEFRLYYMDGISEEDKQGLVENHLISPALLSRPTFSAALINADGNISIMINEEDHLREQCIVKGQDLQGAYDKMSEKDTLIGQAIPFAYDERLGYLTACPTNLGTGLRASVMMFLPAIALSGLMPRVIQSATRLGLTVRGAYGEGSEASGYTYQISNEVTLGVTEGEIISQVNAVVNKIAEMEAGERARLKKGPGAVALKDKCLRAAGVLTNCALMSSEEFGNLCAHLKLAACLGYIQLTDIGEIDGLIIKMKPSNINLMAERTLTSAERDEYRAQYASREIAKIIIK